MAGKSMLLSFLVLGLATDPTMAQNIVSGMNFVPLTPPSTVVSYWTTWYIQNYPANKVEGSNMMGDEQLFSNVSARGCPGCGWATNFFPDARGDMLLCLDDTWFIKPSQFSNQWKIDPVKFSAESPNGAWTTSMAALVNRTKSSGWASLGLWHHAIFMGDNSSQLEDQLSLLAAAGVEHIKVDGTDMTGNVTIDSKIGSKGAVRIEHKRSPGEPVNGDATKDGRATASYISQLADLVGRTDVLRTDDIVCQMSVPTCLERMVQTMAYVYNNNITQPTVAGALGIIAPQDEAYMAAGLSGSLAAMRHPLPQIPGDTRLNGNRLLYRRMDEITRATRWFRIAPPAGLFDYQNFEDSIVLLDPSPLTDAKVLNKSDTWFSKLWGVTAHQGAPARSTRGLKYLPSVTPADERYPNILPYILASKHPNGALAVAALGRTLETFGGWIMPLSNVTVYAGAPSQTHARLSSRQNSSILVGVFGRYAHLNIVWDQAINTDGAAVYMQDLAGRTAVDVTKNISWCSGNTVLSISGASIDRIGVMHASKNDISDPGVVIAITIGGSTQGQHKSTNVDKSNSDICAPIPPAPTPPPPPTPGPPGPPAPPPGPPINPQDFNGTWIQQSYTQPEIDIIVTNNGGDVQINPLNPAGKWTSGSGVILDNVLDVHCAGPSNFTTHQVGTASWGSDGEKKTLVLSWQDGDVRDITEPLHWAVWTKKD